VATPHELRQKTQAEIAYGDSWILDGDLGLYDALDVRLRPADTVALINLPMVVCAWCALRRSREHIAFWRWLLTWRRRFRPKILDAIAANAPDAEPFMVCSGADRHLVLTH
jgi:hypothetical protein